MNGMYHYTMQAEGYITERSFMYKRKPLTKKAWVLERSLLSDILFFSGLRSLKNNKGHSVMGAPSSDSEVVPF